jgi:hypothetical protein
MSTERVYKTEKNMKAYKKVVMRCVVRTDSTKLGEQCYFHNTLRKVIIAELFIPSCTYVCENKETSEVRLERASVLNLEKVEWSLEQQQEIERLQKCGYKLTFRATSFLDLCFFYDEEATVVPFKPFSMAPDLTSLEANGIYAFWTREAAEKFDLFEKDPYSGKKGDTWSHDMTI